MASTLLLLIPLLQIIALGLTLQRLRRWHQDPQLRPSRGRLWGLHILLPLTPNLALATIPALLLVSGMLRFTDACTRPFLDRPDLRRIRRHLDLSPHRAYPPRLSRTSGRKTRTGRLI